MKVINMSSYEHICKCFKKLFPLWGGATEWTPIDTHDNAIMVIFNDRNLEPLRMVFTFESPYEWSLKTLACYNNENKEKRVW